MDRKAFITEMIDILLSGDISDMDVDKCVARINYVIDVEIEGLLKVERIDD